MDNEDILTKVATKAFVEDMVGMVLEKMDDNNRIIMETLMPMKEKVDRIPKIEEDIVEIKQETVAIKRALKATNKDVANHERRITRLEAKTA